MHCPAKRMYSYDLLVCYQYYDVPVVSGNGSLSQSGNACTLSIGSGCIYYNGKYASGQVAGGTNQRNGGVDKVFGRMEMAGLSVSSDVGEGTITLISYDDNQFGWRKKN